MADKFLSRDTAHGLESVFEIADADQVRDAHLELQTPVVVIAFDGGVLDVPVHPLDLDVASGMLHAGEAIFDPVLAATHVEHLRAAVKDPAYSASVQTLDTITLLKTGIKQ